MFGVDDYITKAISDNEGYRYGYTYNGSIMHNFKYNYRNLTKNNPKYTGDYQRVNSMNYIINDIRTNASAKLNALYTDLSNLLANNDTNFANTSNDTDIGAKITELKSYVQNNELRTARITEAYWTLAKTLEGLDEKRTNGRIYTKTIEIADSEHYDYEMVNEDIINIIKNLGVWYVNHITTYQSKLYESGNNPRNHYDRGNDLAHEYLREYATYPDKVTSTNNTLNINNGQDKVKETAIGARINYRHDSDTVNDGDNLVDLAESNSDTVGHPDYAGYVGDDCNSFAMGVIRLISEGRRGDDGNLGTKDKIDLQNTNASAMCTSDRFEDAMLNLGYTKYALRNGVWKQFKEKDGTKQIKPLTEVYRNNDFAMSVNFLQPGDLLCDSGGHVEFYIGYEYDVTYNNMISTNIDTRKKSGISSVTLKKKATQGHSTFGWGGAQNEYPKKDYYFTYQNDGFVWHTGNSSDSGYTVIWRKN